MNRVFYETPAVHRPSSQIPLGDPNYKPKPVDPPWQPLASVALYIFLIGSLVAGFYFGGVERQEQDVSYLPVQK